jgi:hypothetical protein
MIADQMRGSRHHRDDDVNIRSTDAVVREPLHATHTRVTDPVYLSLATPYGVGRRVVDAAG